MSNTHDLPSTAFLQQDSSSKNWFWVETYPEAGEGATKQIRQATEKELTAVVHDRYKPEVD
jgi:hypothetical protein